MGRRGGYILVIFLQTHLAALVSADVWSRFSSCSVFDSIPRWRCFPTLQDAFAKLSVISNEQQPQEQQQQQQQQ
jgi:hypothetical protein